MNQLPGTVMVAIIATLLSAPISSYAESADGLSIEEIIVTAQRREESVQDIPVSVTAINSEQIAQLGIQSTMDIVRIATSLSVLEGNNQTNSTFSIRGIGTNAFGIGVEQAVAMIIDDVALVQQGQALANLVDIERIEVLRGPQSTLFGKASSAGVINITTKQPAESFGGALELGTTNENAYNVLGSVSGPIGDSLGYRITGFWKKRDGYVKNLTPGQGDLNGEESQGFRAKLRWEISETAEAQLTAYYTSEESQCCGRVLADVDPDARLFGFIPDFKTGITPSPENTTIRQDKLPDSKNDIRGVNFRLSFDIGEFQLISVTAYDSWEYINSEDVDAGDLDVLAALTSGAASGGFFSDATRDSDFISQEIRLLSPAKRKFNYLLGFYYSATDIDRTFFRVLPVAPANWAGSAGSKNYAFFGQFNYQFTGKASIGLGLRYINEKISAEFLNRAATMPIPINATDTDDAVVGKLSFQYFLNDDTMVFASYARGYKGQAYDLTPEFDLDRAANPVEAESSDAYEVGLKSTFWDQRMQLNLTAFHTKYDNFQVQTTDSTSDVVRFQLANVGELETQGVELESIVRLSEQLTLTFNASYTDSSVNDFTGAACYPGQTAAEGCVEQVQTIDGGTLPNSPDLKFTTMLDYERSFENVPLNFFANVLYSWQDEVRFGIDQGPLTVQDSYGITNLRFGIVDKSGRYQVSVFVNNVFDENYRSSLADFRVLFGQRRAVVHVHPRNSQRYVGITTKLNF